MTKSKASCAFSIGPDLRIQFLMNFPHQRLLGCFPGFDLSTRELPPALVFTIAARRREDSIAIADHRRHYSCSLSLYCLHLKL